MGLGDAAAAGVGADDAGFAAVRGVVVAACAGVGLGSAATSRRALPSGRGVGLAAAATRLGRVVAGFAAARITGSATVRVGRSAVGAATAGADSAGAATARAESARFATATAFGDVVVQRT